MNCNVMSVWIKCDILWASGNHGDGSALGPGQLINFNFPTLQSGLRRITL